MKVEVTKSSYLDTSEGLTLTGKKGMDLNEQQEARKTAKFSQEQKAAAIRERKEAETAA